MYFQSSKLAMSISLMWAIGLITIGILLIVAPDLLVPIFAGGAILTGVIMLFLACAIRVSLRRS